MTEETRIALMNYDWLIRNDGLEEIELHWPTSTLILRTVVRSWMSCAIPASTPATTPEGLAAAHEFESEFPPS